MKKEEILIAANQANGYLLFCKDTKAEPFNDGFVSGVNWALPKWIPIDSIKELPSEEANYLTLCKTDYPPYYRKDVFCGRLSNAVDAKTGRSIFSHYSLIVFPELPI